MIAFMIASLLMVGAGAETPSPRTQADVPFPLEPGVVWRFRGEVRWTAPNSSEVLAKTLEWPITVVASVRRGAQTISLVTGWFDELAWYDPETKPGAHLLVHERGAGLYVLGKRENATGIWERVTRDPRETVHERELMAGNLLLVPDLEEGRRWEYRDGLERWVENVNTKSLRGISGWRGAKSDRVFEIMYGGNTDHELFEFVPNLGITRFTWAHHGTVAECDLRLFAIERAALAPGPH